MLNFFRSSGYYFDGAGAVGILFLRLFAGLGLFFHGLPKIQSANSFGFAWMGPDAPVPGILQFLAAATEVFGGIALMLGLFTPLVALGIMSTMFVAILSHLTNDATPTWFVKPGKAEGDSYELALGYFVMALTVLLSGPGLLSLDALLFGRKRRI